MVGIYCQDNILGMSNHYWDLVLYYCKIQTGESDLISEKCEIPRSYLDQSVLVPKSKKHDPDTPSITEGFLGENQVHLQEYIEEEIKSLVTWGTRKEVRESKLFKVARVIMLPWAFKMNRNITG